MWAALLTDAGEIEWLGRSLLRRTGDVTENGLVIYQSEWVLQRDLPANLICFAAIYDAEVGGMTIGMRPFDELHGQLIAGNTLTVRWPIRFGRDSGPSPEPTPAPKPPSARVKVPVGVARNNN